MEWKSRTPKSLWYVWHNLQIRENWRDQRVKSTFQHWLKKVIIGQFITSKVNYNVIYSLSTSIRWLIIWKVNTNRFARMIYHCRCHLSNTFLLTNVRSNISAKKKLTEKTICDIRPNKLPKLPMRNGAKMTLNIWWTKMTQLTTDCLLWILSKASVSRWVKFVTAI